jgi:hypothetical protein
MLRKISEPDKDANKDQFMLLHNEERRNLCMSPGILMVAKFIMLLQAAYVARTDIT